MQPTTVEWCDAEPANGRLYDTSIGVEKCISMCVKKSPIPEFQYHITVRPVPLHLAGQYPLNNPGDTEVSMPIDSNLLALMH